MRNLQFKSVQGEVVDVDDNSRKVVNVFSKMDVLDSQNDVIEKGAFNKTLKDWGPQNGAKGRIWHLKNHDYNLDVAKFSELYVDGDKLIGVTILPDTTLGNDMLTQYKAGNYTEHSIGFETIKRENKGSGNDSYRLIQEVKLHEGSTVLWGANSLTPNISVGKSLDLLNEFRKTDLYKETIAELISFAKKLNKGNDSRIEFKALQLATQFEILSQDLFQEITQPAQEEKAVEPIIKNDEAELIYQKLLLIDLKLKAAK